MAKNNGGVLTTIGKILGLIAGILAIVYGALYFLDQTISALNDAFSLQRSNGGSLGGAEWAIINIIIGVLLVFVCINRIKIDDILWLGIVVIILGVVGGGWLAIIGGILILIDLAV